MAFEYDTMPILTLPHTHPYGSILYAIPAHILVTALHPSSAFLQALVPLRLGFEDRS